MPKWWFRGGGKAESGAYKPARMRRQVPDKYLAFLQVLNDLLSGYAARKWTFTLPHALPVPCHSNYLPLVWYMSVRAGSVDCPRQA